METPNSSKPTPPTPPDYIPKALQHYFIPTIEGGWQAQFESALAATLVEQDLAEAGVTYRTTVVKSKKRGVIYVVYLPQLGSRRAA